MTRTGLLNNEYKIVFALIIALASTLLILIAVLQMYGVHNYTSISSYEDQVKQLVFDVMKGVEEIRGLTIGRDIEIKLINTSWAIKTWAPKEDTEIPKELLYKELLYKLTFILPYDRSIVQKEREWVGMFAAAVAGKTLYINTDYFDPKNPSIRNLLAHELTHVAQFLHFHIETPQILDNRLAILTLVEGDAGWTQHLYCIKTKLCEPSPPTYIYLDDLYLSLNLFPYIYGENFVRYLHDHGGWDLVNKAYSKPPKSTLMILKPEVYLDYLLNNVDIVINVSLYTVEIGNCVYSDVLGAYYVMLILAKHTGLDIAQDIATNWRGDRVALCNYEEGNRSVWVVLWNITWSNPLYATNFYNNLTSMLRNRGEVYELGKGKVVAIIEVRENLKHVIEIEIVTSNSVFIKSWFTEENHS